MSKSSEIESALERADKMTDEFVSCVERGDCVNAIKPAKLAMKALVDVGKMQTERIKAIGELLMPSRCHECRGKGVVSVEHENAEGESWYSRGPCDTCRGQGITLARLTPEGAKALYEAVTLESFP